MLHDDLLDVLGREIVEGSVPAGAVLTLEGLGTRFGVSRTVTREVMRLLESMGLVTSRRRVGIVVRPAVDWDVYDPRLLRWRLAGSERPAQLRSLTELRSAVEPVAARLAAQRGSAAGDELVELAARMRVLGEAGRLAEFMVVDAQFHALVLRASRNEMFAALADVVEEVLRGRTEHGLMPPRPEPRALAAHEAVAAAVQAGDSPGAEAAMSAIVNEVSAALTGTE
ncbi:MAG TPA: FCD domain-containing protein [Actinotalea sp.]